MPTDYSVLSSSVYIAFRSIPKKGWNEVIKLYETKSVQVALLPTPKRLDVLHMYVESLHEIKDYLKLQEVVGELIMLSLSDEIPVDVGRPYYEDALFWKADASLNLMSYKESTNILQQLIRLNPRERMYARKLVRATYNDKPNYVRKFKAVAVVLFFLSAAVILLEIMIVKPFYGMHTASVEWLRNMLFLSALGTVASVELFHWLNCELKVKRLIQSALDS